MIERTKTSRRRNFYNGVNNFQNGHEHNQRLVKGIPEKFAVIENGEHQRGQNGKPKESIGIIFDDNYLMSLDETQSWEKINVFVKAQYALQRAKR